jgi:hypothetical protein
MGMPVVSVAAGGLPVVESTNGFGTPVTEANPKWGVAVTKVISPAPGLPVIFETFGIGGGAGTTYVTFDAATLTAVTLSSGDLVATNTGTTSVDQGARCANAAGKTSGKYYFEVINTTALAGANCGFGIGTTASTYTNMGNSATTGDIMFRSNGNIWRNGSTSGITVGARTQGDVMGVAADLDNRTIWFRGTSAGNWNNNVANNPATNTGGVLIPAGTMVPFVVFGGTSGLANNKFTANFGASAFSGAVPAGFTSGWPA